jgi:hypothetical protein
MLDLLEYALRIEAQLWGETRIEGSGGLARLGIGVRGDDADLVVI